MNLLLTVALDSPDHFRRVKRKMKGVNILGYVLNKTDKDHEIYLIINPQDPEYILLRISDMRGVCESLDLLEDFAYLSGLISEQTYYQFDILT